MPAIDRFLRHVVLTGASDFHLTSGARPMVRRHGEMLEEPDLQPAPFEEGDVLAMLEAIAPPPKWAEFTDSGDTDFAYAVEGLGRFRVNVFRHQDGTGAVLRFIPAEIVGIEDLGLPASIAEFCSLNKGLVLVTGPTGCGKSTTLAAMVDHMNRTRRDHIVTIEDPVEYVHEDRLCHIHHREVGPHTRSFRHALRAALRQDPDIILVGEMRDLETTEIAIETAETGHLVLGTLHTSTAASTVDRVIDQFPVERQPQIRTMLSVSLKGVVCQTLLRRRDGRGRVPALEVMKVTSGIANLIREGKTHQIPSAIQTGRRDGMQLLGDDLLHYVREGIVHPAEAYRQAVEKSDLEQRLRAEGFDRHEPEDEPEPYADEGDGADPDAPPADTPANVTRVYAAGSPADANGVAAYLRAAGIEVVVEAGDPDGGHGASVSVFSPDDVDRALDLIARREAAFGG